MNFREKLKSISPEEIKRQNEKQFRENKEMFEEFQDAYSKNCCALCGNKLDSFDIDEECFHWFLLPTGIRKKDFDNYLKQPIGYFNLESYLRWMSTILQPFKNINDLSSNDTSKLGEVTIKYNNIEWSLNYGKSDLEGHQNSNYGKEPHFHIQVYKDKKPFIVFNNYHIPFSEFDLKCIKLKEEAGDLMEFTHSQSPGASFIEDTTLMEELEKELIVSNNPKTALINSQSMIIMPKGEQITEEEFVKIQEESKQTRIPMRILFKKYYPEAQITTEATPAEGYPEKRIRTKRRKKR